MSDRLFALRLFARVARKGSFSAAGRELNIPQSTASRTIATLEREIGVALFVRTTRVVTLTDAGLDFLARIESVLAELDEAEQENCAEYCGSVWQQPLPCGRSSPGFRTSCAGIRRYGST
jgi:DNA-binding transcriptional LysR family regulator